MYLMDYITGAECTDQSVLWRPPYSPLLHHFALGGRRMCHVPVMILHTHNCSLCPDLNGRNKFCYQPVQVAYHEIQELSPVALLHKLDWYSYLALFGFQRIVGKWLISVWWIIRFVEINLSVSSGEEIVIKLRPVRGECGRPVGGDCVRVVEGVCRGIIARKWLVGRGRTWLKNRRVCGDLRFDSCSDGGLVGRARVKESQGWFGSDDGVCVDNWVVEVNVIVVYRCRCGGWNKGWRELVGWDSSIPGGWRDEITAGLETWLRTTRLGSRWRWVIID